MNIIKRFPLKVKKKIQSLNNMPVEIFWQWALVVVAVFLIIVLIIFNLI